MKSIFSNSVYSLFGRVIFALSQWMIVVLMARLGGASEVGVFVMALAFVTPVFMFASLQLRQAQAVDAADRHRFSDFLTLRLATNLAAVIISVGLAAASGSMQLTLLTTAVAIAKLFEFTSEIFHGLFQKHQSLKLIARSNTIRALAYVCIVFPLYYVVRDVQAVGIGMALGNLAVLVVHDIPTAARFLKLDEPNWTGDALQAFVVGWRDRIWPLVVRTFPLGVTMLLVNLQQQIPRYFINSSLGLEAVGYFGGVAYLVQLGGIVVGAIGQAFAPAMARHWENGETREFSLTLITLVGVNLAIGLCTVLAGYIAPKLFVDVFYGDKFHAAIPLVGPMMVAGAASFVASATGFGATAAQEFKVQPKIYGVSVVGSALVAWIGITGWGLVGGAWSLLAPSLIIALLLGHMLRQRIRAKEAALR